MLMEISINPQSVKGSITLELILSYQPIIICQLYHHQCLKLKTTPTRKITTVNPMLHYSSWAYNNDFWRHPHCWSSKPSLDDEIPVKQINSDLLMNIIFLVISRSQYKQIPLYTMKYTHYIISYPHKMLINCDQPTQRSLKPYLYCCWLHMCHCVP